MKILINQKKFFNPSILLVLNIVAFSQFAFSENESNAYLDLSEKEISNISIELNTYCTPKNLLNEIYGNGNHNIPLEIKAVALSNDGEKISIEKKDILRFTKIQAMSWGEDVSLSDEINENNKNSIITLSNKYTKCIGENNTYFSESEDGFYFKSKAVGKTIDLGAKFYYQDKNGKHVVSTLDSERLKINVLQNPLSTVSSEALFGIKLTSDYYDSIFVKRNNYRLFKIFPLVDKFPTLTKVNLSTIRITNKDTGESSGFVVVDFNKSQNLTDDNHNYIMPIEQFSQSKGDYGQSKRSFINGYLISGLKKANSKVDKISFAPNSEKIFSLNDISYQDFGFVTVSNSGTPLHIWEYQWDVPFLLELAGFDSYGNYFSSHLHENF
ncbi:hypothetical protein [Spirobacillus cienkowskii]|uniref:hypothetical protein n=1 Tax=Spirobacillus cienkowskii TaxID=495820 RepID=UPI0030D391A8